MGWGFTGRRGRLLRQWSRGRRGGGHSSARQSTRARSSCSPLCSWRRIPSGRGTHPCPSGRSARGAPSLRAPCTVAGRTRASWPSPPSSPLTRARGWSLNTGSTCPPTLAAPCCIFGTGCQEVAIIQDSAFEKGQKQCEVTIGPVYSTTASISSSRSLEFMTTSSCIRSRSWGILRSYPIFCSFVAFSSIVSTPLGPKKSSTCAQLDPKKSSKCALLLCRWSSKLQFSTTRFHSSSGQVLIFKFVVAHSWSCP